MVLSHFSNQLSGLKNNLSFKESISMSNKKTTSTKKTVLGSTFQSFLEEEGILEEVNIQAIKQIIALQLLDAMKSLNIIRLR